MAATAPAWPAGHTLAEGAYNNRIRVNLLEFLCTGFDIKQSTFTASTRLLDAYMAEVVARRAQLQASGGHPDQLAAYNERCTPAFLLPVGVACLELACTIHESEPPYRADFVALLGRLNPQDVPSVPADLEGRSRLLSELELDIAHHVIGWNLGRKGPVIVRAELGMVRPVVDEVSSHPSASVEAADFSHPPPMAPPYAALCNKAGSPCPIEYTHPLQVHDTVYARVLELLACVGDAAAAVSATTSPAAAAPASAPAGPAPMLPCDQGAVEAAMEAVARHTAAVAWLAEPATPAKPATGRASVTGVASSSSSPSLFRPFARLPVTQRLASLLDASRFEVDYYGRPAELLAAIPEPAIATTPRSSSQATQAGLHSGSAQGAYPSHATPHLPVSRLVASLTKNSPSASTAAARPSAALPNAGWASGCDAFEPGLRDALQAWRDCTTRCAHTPSPRLSAALYLDVAYSLDLLTMLPHASAFPAKILAAAVVMHTCVTQARHQELVPLVDLAARAYVLRCAPGLLVQARGGERDAPAEVSGAAAAAAPAGSPRRGADSEAEPATPAASPYGCESLSVAVTCTPAFLPLDATVRSSVVATTAASEASHAYDAVWTTLQHAYKWVAFCLKNAPPRGDRWGRSTDWNNLIESRALLHVLDAPLLQARWGHDRLARTVLAHESRLLREVLAGMWYHAQGHAHSVAAGGPAGDDAHTASHHPSCLADCAACAGEAGEAAGYAYLLRPLVRLAALGVGPAAEVLRPPEAVLDAIRSTRVRFPAEVAEDPSPLRRLFMVGNQVRSALTELGPVGAAFVTSLKVLVPLVGALGEAGEGDAALPQPWRCPSGATPSQLPAWAAWHSDLVPSSLPTAAFAATPKAPAAARCPSSSSSGSSSLASLVEVVRLTPGSASLLPSSNSGGSPTAAAAAAVIAAAAVDAAPPPNPAGPIPVPAGVARPAPVSAAAVAAPARRNQPTWLGSPALRMAGRTRPRTVEGAGAGAAALSAGPGGEGGAGRPEAEVSVLPPPAKRARVAAEAATAPEAPTAAPDAVDSQSSTSSSSSHRSTASSASGGSSAPASRAGTGPPPISMASSRSQRMWASATGSQLSGVGVQPYRASGAGRPAAGAGPAPATLAAAAGGGVASSSSRAQALLAQAAASFASSSSSAPGAPATRRAGET